MNSLFRLKQFELRQEQSALKVGTDGMLLGAVVADRFRGTSVGRVLDVGTGTGVIALMVAQELPNADVVGIELDPATAEEAECNAQASPFAPRVSVLCADFRTYVAAPFHLIVSNPPFYTATHSSADQRSTVAKHAITLSADSFFQKCQELLSPMGTIAVILAPSALSAYENAATSRGFFLNETIAIYTKAGRPLKRVIAFWSRRFTPHLQNSITILSGNGRHDYTEEYARLLRPYLIIL